MLAQKFNSYRKDYVQAYIANGDMEKFGIPLDIWLQTATVFKLERNQRVFFNLRKQKW